MANFSLDQADGLRRMLSEPKPRIVTLLSTLGAAEKNAMLTNLTATLTQMGSDTVLVDARRFDGVSKHLNTARKNGLLEVARQQCALSEVVQTVPQGFSIVAMSGERLVSVREDATENQRLSKVFSVLAQQYGTMLVDGELDSEDRLPVTILDSGTIIIHLAAGAESIKSGYCLIKRLSATLGRRSFGILVTQCEEAQARLVYANLAQTASRYLAVSLYFMGSIPADDHLSRAARLGRSVIEAFPLAMASVAFRRIAGQLGLS
ncbi:MAG: MinD/ParA family ATP-binding protein [Sulfuriferula sp.]